MKLLLVSLLIYGTIQTYNWYQTPVIIKKTIQRDGILREDIGSQGVVNESSNTLYPRGEEDTRRERRSGKVSWYGTESCTNEKCHTANGEVFTGAVGTCACSYDYKLGDQFRVTYHDNSVVVRCNDRGGFEPLGRILDLSKGSFEVLAPLSKGVIEVEIEKI